MALFEKIKELFFGPFAHGNASTQYPTMNEVIDQGNQYADDAQKLRESPELREEADREINAAIDADLNEGGEADYVGI